MIKVHVYQDKNQSILIGQTDQMLNRPLVKKTRLSNLDNKKSNGLHSQMKIIFSQAQKWAICSSYSITFRIYVIKEINDKEYALWEKEENGN